LGILPLAAQKQSNIWYFGRNAGLDFNNFHAQPLPPGPINSPEGVATYCDSQGNILLSSDGKRIWNSFNLPLNYPDLSGDPNSTQPVTFVPSPWDPNKVYLFTTKPFDSADPDNYGGNYYTIDLTNPAQPVIVNNAQTGVGGLIKNSSEKFLCIPTTFFNPVTGNQDPGYWIIMHEFGNNVFRVFKFQDGVLTDNGSQSVGTPHLNGTDDDGSNLGGSGQMKADINGNFIALAVEGGRFFEVFTFNKTTGVIRRRFTLPAGEEDFKDQRIHQAYGVEFSPTGNYLYGSARDVAFVYRWDLSEFSQDNIIKFCRFLSENFAAEGGAMQLAPNGKIYVAFNDLDYLGIINSPIRVDCDFRKFGARLINNETGLGGGSTYGLPAPVAGSIGIQAISFTNNCSDTTVTFYITEPGNISSPRSWTFTNLTTGVKLKQQTIPNSNECILINPPSGVYEIKVQFIRSGLQTLTITMEIFDPPHPELYVEDVMPVCRGSIIELDAGYGAFYEWDDKSLESRKRKIDIDTLQFLLNEVRVKVTGYNGCVGWDVIQLAPRNPPEVTTQTTKATCGDPNGSATVIPISGEISDYTYLWEHDSSTQNILDNIPFGSYRVHVRSKSPPYCETIDTVFVEDFSAQSIQIQSVDTAVCPGSRVTLKIIGEPDKFKWINPPEASGKEVLVYPDTTTCYQLQVTSYNGKDSCTFKVQETVQVHPVKKPKIIQNLVPPFCEGQTITLSGGEDFGGIDYENYSWLDGQGNVVGQGKEHKISATIFGLFVKVTDQNGCDTVSISNDLKFNPLPKVDLGPDTTYCAKERLLTPVDDGGAMIFNWNDGEGYLKEFMATKTQDYKLTVTKDGCSNSDVVHVQLNDPEALKILSVKSVDITCNGMNNGSIEIEATGDGKFFEFSIDNELTYSDSGRFEDLKPGEYKVWVMEDRVCRQDWKSKITLIEPSRLGLDFCIQHPKAVDSEDGSIVAQGSGGNGGPYTLVMNGDPQFTNSITGLKSGTYEFNVFDKKGCSLPEPRIVILDGSKGLKIRPSKSGTVCPGEPITLDVINADGEVTWREFPGSHRLSQPVNPIITTIYQVFSSKFLSDGTPCVANAEITIEVWPSFTVGLKSVTDNTCFVKPDSIPTGSVEISVDPVGAYDYKLDDGPWQHDDPKFLNVGPGGDHRVWVRDVHNCERPYEGIIDVLQPEDSLRVIVKMRSPTTSGGSNGQIILDISGGTPDYTIFLDGELKTGERITGLSERTEPYLLLVVDQNKCEWRQEVTVDMKNEIPNVITPDGNNVNDVWKIPLLTGLTDCQVRVFDLNGKLVFQADGEYTDPWDGTLDNQGNDPCPAGIYFYIIDLGSVWEGEIRRGSVTLLRGK
jgi:gliding motility-associated-like protein